MSKNDIYKNILPLTLNYFSPVHVLEGAFLGIVNASLIVFGLMFIIALFFGRLWCGWACPAGGLAEACVSVNRKQVKTHWIKWAIWIPWVSLIAFFAMRGGGYREVNIFFRTDSIVSVDEPSRFFIYYTVLGIFTVLSMFVGKRAVCHTICWMAPFMILGRKVRNLFNWPALRLAANPDECKNCKKCSRECPMSLDVNAMVQGGVMENPECILCGTCIDGCPEKAIRYAFSSGQ